MSRSAASTWSLVSLLALAVLGGCSGGGDKPAAPAPASKAAASGAPAASAAPAADSAAAPAGGPNMVALTKLNLKAEVPAGTEAKDAIVGDGIVLQGPGLVATVEAATDSRPKTLADAKKDADMYAPKNLKEEILPDGWALTFDNEGGLGKMYWVESRREIGGKAIWCETTASQPEQENALKACKSLKP